MRSRFPWMAHAEGCTAFWMPLNYVLTNKAANFMGVLSQLKLIIV